MVYEERLIKRKKESTMFRLDYNLMGDIKGIAESTEDTLSRTLRYLIRLGIDAHKRNFAGLMPKDKEKEVEEA